VYANCNSVCFTLEADHVHFSVPDQHLVTFLSSFPFPRPLFIVQSESSRHVEKMASRAGTLTSETILRPDSNNFRVRVSVRVPFKLVIRSRTPVSGRNVETPCSYIRYSYMLRFAKFARLYSCEALFLSLHLLDCILAFLEVDAGWRSLQVQRGYPYFCTCAN